MWLANVAATLYGSGPVVSMLVTSRLWGGSWKKGYWALPAAGMKSLVRSSQSRVESSGQIVM